MRVLCHMVLSVNIICLIGSYSPHALAQNLANIPNISCSEAAPTQCSLPLLKGKKAPFSGTLLTDQLALSLDKQLEEWPKTLAREMDRLDGRHAATLKYRDDLALVKKDATEKREQMLKDEITRLQPSFWEHPMFVSSMTILALGVAAGIAGTIANAVD